MRPWWLGVGVTVARSVPWRLAEVCIVNTTKKHPKKVETDATHPTQKVGTYDYWNYW